MNNEEYNEYLQKMMSVCSNNEKCAFDIEQKLIKYNIAEEDIRRIISDLQDYDFINHKRYVEAFINDKLRFNHWGKRKIEHALRAKNIDETLIQTKLEEIDPGFYEKILKKELEKKINKLPQPIDKEGENKIIRFLTQKGFDYGKIFDILERRANKE